MAIKVASLPNSTRPPTANGTKHLTIPAGMVQTPQRQQQKPTHSKKASNVSDKLRSLGFDHIPPLEQVCQRQESREQDTSSPDFSDYLSEPDYHAADPVFTVSTFSRQGQILNGHAPANSSSAANGEAIRAGGRKRKIPHSAVSMV